MTKKLFTPAHRPLETPGTGRRVLRRPDLRGLGAPRPSGAPLGPEVDYDELVIHRSYRVFDDVPGDAGAEVKYFVFEYSQRNPGEIEWFTGVKVVRLLRLTRVPRYLRGGSSGEINLVFQQQRDVLAALREEQVLFLNLIAHSPDMPLAFCYGTQAVGATFEEAAARADESFEVLRFQLFGTYQQLKVAPLTMDEGEKIAKYQAEWNHIAMARGRPLPAGGTMPMADLDGNRTDIASANNQLESFLRGMSDRHFLMTLVTVPLAPAEMSMAWRNLSQKLSDVRSDQQGARAFNAGVALPLGLGMSLGESHGDTHSTGASRGVGDSYGVSQSVSDSYSTSESASVSASVTDGTNASVSYGETASVSTGQSLSVTEGASVGQSLSATEGVSETGTVGRSSSLSQGVSQSESLTLGESLSRSIGQTESISHGMSQGQSASVTDGSTESVTRTDGLSRSVSLGESASTGQSASMTRGSGVSESSSLGNTVSSGQNWSSNIGQSFNSSLSQMDSWSRSLSESLQQSFNLGNTTGDGLNTSESFNRNYGVNGGLLGFSGSNGETHGRGSGQNLSNSDTIGAGLTRGGSLTGSVAGARTFGFGEGISFGETLGGSVGTSTSATNTVGRSESLAATEGISNTIGRSVTETMGASQSLAQGLARSQSMTQGVSATESLTRGTSLSETLGASQSIAHGRTVGSSLGTTEGISAAQSLGRSAGVTEGITSGRSIGVTEGVSTGQSLSQSASSSQGVSHSTTQGVGRTASESVGQSLTQGESAGIASNRSMSDAYMVAMSRTASNTGTLGAVPSIGVSVSRQTFDESKRVLGDVLQSQMRRYLEGVESGAFLYQMFLTAPDRTTLKGAAALLKSAFWGAGSNDERIAQPFHTIVDFEDDERSRLLDHARCFTSYRKRESVVEEISPFLYSSYITPTELSALTHPPTANALGLEAQFDSMPVLAMPADRQNRDLYLGQVINGERGEVSRTRYGLNVDEVTHMLITGVTGSGKTSSLNRYLTELTQVEKTITAADPTTGTFSERPLRAGILGLDWMRNMRNLRSVVDEDRFRFYSVSKPEMGEFRWNLLAIPAEGMSAAEWLNQMADNMVASWNLGEFGRSLLAEMLSDLYSYNRLVPNVLLPAQTDPDTGAIVREAIVLPVVGRDELPDGAIQFGPDGREIANVYTCAELSRLVSIEHLAVLVMARVEEMATVEAARLSGSAMRDRLQSLWRRISYFAPGGTLSDLLGCDESLSESTTLTVRDLISPDEGLVVIVETDGLDMANRRLVLGSVLMAIYRYGLAHGEGVFDHDGQGPGTHIVLEESHELFGEGGEDDDAFSVATRNALYESLFRRSRALGIRLVAVAQNPGTLPVAVTSNTSTVLVHRCYDTNDRKRVFDLLNMNNQLGQQQREWRFLGEMPVGWCIVRTHARESYLESAPVMIRSEIAPLERISDAEMVELEAARRLRDAQG
jgi:hypothetical protein